MRQVVIIPTIDPTASLVEVVDGLSRLGLDRFIIVDDGSDQRCLHVFRRLEERGCTVLHHESNAGKGAAIKTALSKLREIYPDACGFVTVDDDGQHLPVDVMRVLAEGQRRKGAIVLGCRNLHARNVPTRSRIGNAFSSLYFRFDTGKRCADTQTGLRYIPVELTGFAREVEGDRYDYEMNFLTAAVKRGIEVVDVEITTVYVDDNSASHFNPLHDSYLIFRSFIRFSLSSLLCAAIDLGLFALITALLSTDIYVLVLTATVVARLSSGGVNFLLNRNWSFSAKGEARTQLIRYLILFFGLMFSSTAFVTLLSSLAIPLVLTKVLVDSALFVLSYFVQHNWVFVTEKDRHDGKVKTLDRII